MRLVLYILIIESIIFLFLVSASEEASLVPIPLPPHSLTPTIHDYVFLIKWLRKSHLHNSWETYNSLVERAISGVRKVENFYRRMEVLRSERLKMTEVSFRDTCDLDIRLTE